MKFEVFCTYFQASRPFRIPNLNAVEIKSKKDLKFLYFYVERGARHIGLEENFDSEETVNSLIAEMDGFDDELGVLAQNRSIDTDLNIYVLNSSNYLELILERIRLNHLKTAGFYNRDSLNSESKLQKLSEYLSISYFMTVNSVGRNDEVALLNIEFLSIFSGSMPASWFSPHLVAAVTYLLENISKSPADPSFLLEILSSHSACNKNLGEHSLKVYGLLERLCEQASPDCNSMIIQILAQYAQIDIFAIPFLENLLCVNFTFNQQVSLAIGKVLLSFGDSKYVSSISQTLFRKRLDDLQSLFITKIYYYYGNEKCKSYKLFSSFDKLFDDFEMNETGMFGLLGYIRAHQDSNYHSSALLRRIFDGLNICKSAARLFIAGEVVYGGKVNIERFMDDKMLRAFILEGFETLLSSELYLSVSTKSLTDKVSSGYFKSLTRICNCLCSGLEAVIDDVIMIEVINIIHDFAPKLIANNSDDSDLLRYEKAVLYCIQSLLGPVSKHLASTRDELVVLKILQIMEKMKFITAKFPNPIIDAQMNIYISIMKETAPVNLIKFIDKFCQPFKSDLIIYLVESLPEDYIDKEMLQMPTIDTRHRLYTRIVEYGEKFPALIGKVLDHIKSILETNSDKQPERIGEIILALGQFSFQNRRVRDNWKKESVKLGWDWIGTIVDSYKVAKVTNRQQLFKVLAYQIGTVPFVKLEDFLVLLEEISNDEPEYLKIVYESISDPDLVDYSRRYKCASWYLKFHETLTRKISVEEVDIKAKL